MSTMESKSSLGSSEFSSLTIVEVSGNDPDGQSKSPPTDDHDNEGEFQKFSALLDRIQALQKIFKRKRMNCSPPEDIPSSDQKSMESKSSWKPSFIWEDFCSCRQNLQCLVKENKCAEQDYSSSNKVVVGSSVKHVSIDLNAYPTIE